MTTWTKDDAFDILNYIRNNVNLVHLMDSLENVNSGIIIVGHWIFDYNYKEAGF